LMLSKLYDFIVKKELDKNRNIQQIVQCIYEINHGDLLKSRSNQTRDPDFEIVFDSLDLLKIQLQSKIVKHENIDHLFSQINLPYFIVDILKRKAYQFNKKAIHFFDLKDNTESIDYNIILDDEFISKIELFYQSELDSMNVEHVFDFNQSKHLSLVQLSKFDTFYATDSHISVIITDYSEKKKEELTRKEQALFEKTIEINNQISRIVENEFDEPLKKITKELNNLRFENFEQFDTISSIKKMLGVLITNIDLLKVNTSLNAISSPQNVNEVNVLKFIQNCIHGYLYQSIEKNCFLNYNLEEGIENVVLDEAKVLIVLNNIISSLLKFSSNNTIEINISQPDKNKAVLAFNIKATHIYIEPDNLDIFINYSNPNISGVETNGFGISMCKNLVEYLGGELKMKSYENLGSIFEFEIPFVNS
jgi:signal transduction histidine kinase